MLLSKNQKKISLNQGNTAMSEKKKILKLSHFEPKKKSSDMVACSAPKTTENSLSCQIYETDENPLVFIRPPSFRSKGKDGRRGDGKGFTFRDTD